MGICRHTGSATGEEVHLRRTRAVTECDRARESDEVAGGDTMLGDERLLQVDNLIETNVWMERSLNCVEDNDRAVGTSTTAKWLSSTR